MPKLNPDRSPIQPLGLVHVDDARLNLPTVCALTGWSASTVWRRVRDGTLAKPERFGVRCTRWKAQDVRRCLAQETVPAS